jgi:tetratricopeptide (TPR) repeat protein
MASALGRALQLSVMEISSGSSLRTRSPEAQDIYFRGMHALDRYTPQGCEEAAADFQRAIDLDPQFVRAHELLGFAHYLQAANAFVPADSGYERVRDDAIRILKLSNHSSLAHSLLVWVNTLYAWDWSAAQRESAMALDDGPRDWVALQSAGDLAMSLGQLDRAEQLLRAALVTDPLSADSVFDLSQVIQARGRLSEAEGEARRGLAIDPTFAYGHFMLGNVLLAQGQSEEALNAYEQEIPEGAKYPGLAKAYHAARRTAESKSALDKAIREYAGSQAFDIGVTYAYLGDSDKAFEWLDRGLRQKDIEFQYIRTFLELSPLRSDPRYKALLNKMNLPE